MKWYLKVLKKYATFSGRARRMEFWMFLLFHMLFTMAAVRLDTVLGLDVEGMDYGLLYMLYTLGVMVPALAVQVRRLHDMGKSGWTVLLLLIPLVGIIWLAILYTRNSQPGINKWGLNPKEMPSGRPA